MSVDVINSIIEAEKHGEEIIKDAQGKASDILRQAEVMGHDIIAKAQEQAEEQRRQMLLEAEQQAQMHIDHLWEQNDKECQAIRQVGQEKLGVASSFIMERIVKSYGDH